MNRAQLEHVLRAAGAIVDERALVVIGSQAILGAVPNPPPELRESAEVDLYPLHNPDRADLIDGAIGEGSMFFSTFGYYAHGVGPETVKAPAGWEDRLVAFRTPATKGVTGWCLEPHDLVLAKATRLDPKDLRYLEVALRSGIVELSKLRERLPSLPVAPEVREIIGGRLDQIERGIDGPSDRGRRR